MTRPNVSCAAGCVTNAATPFNVIFSEDSSQCESGCPRARWDCTNVIPQHCPGRTGENDELPPEHTWFEHVVHASELPHTVVVGQVLAVPVEIQGDVDVSPLAMHHDATSRCGGGRTGTVVASTHGPAWEWNPWFFRWTAPVSGLPCTLLGTVTWFEPAQTSRTRELQCCTVPLPRVHAHYLWCSHS